VVSPPVSDPSVKLPIDVVIVLQLDDGNATTVYTGITFQYRPDPLFIDIQPRNHLIVSVIQLLTYFCFLFQMWSDRTGTDSQSTIK